MAARTGTIIDVEDAKPEEVEVDAENPKVRRMKRALRDTGTVKVRSEDGRTLFYCLEPCEYRRLKEVDEARG